MANYSCRASNPGAAPGSRTVNGDQQFNAAVDDQALKLRLTPADTTAAVAFPLQRWRGRNDRPGAVRRRGLILR
jgi:hypothetical protein